MPFWAFLQRKSAKMLSQNLKMEAISRGQACLRSNHTQDHILKKCCACTVIALGFSQATL